MAKRIGGTRRKTRHKFAKNVRQRGKISLAHYFQSFSNGDNVCLVAEPSIHKGLYHARFHGKAGTITGKRGSCYEVKIQDLNMQKTLIVHPIHLRRF
ncbi:MAG TPA: 50S ribosomal protein L21e [Candidatus Nanoarchaeia archaeon]|nr:50S ribosomal protein L21e [Candidatus Nanoarchaeia archaeon]